MHNFRTRIRVGFTCCVLLWVSAPAVAQTSSPTTETRLENDTAGTATAGDGSLESSRVSLDTARERARVMHEIYASTLDVMHQRYFHGQRAFVPARAMEDIFRDIERQMHIQARWIAASLSPMSINHEPKTEFEKSAADKIARGEKSVDTVEDGYYRRMGSIPLDGGCINCHAGASPNMSASKKFVGLVISIPITKH